MTALGQAHTVAITVDDLPFASGKESRLSPADAKEAERVNKMILHVFARSKIPATGFVIEKGDELLGQKAADMILRQWTKPGFDLGNHFYSHADTDKLSLSQIDDEITRGEATIKPLLAEASRTPRYLRFPYNHTGDTREKHDAIAAFLLSRGYKFAPCTIDTSDYEFNRSYVVALSRKDKQTAKRIQAAYIELQACNQSLCDIESSVSEKLASRGRLAGNGSIRAGLSLEDYLQHAAAIDITNYFLLVPFRNSCKVRQGAAAILERCGCT